MRNNTLINAKLIFGILFLLFSKQAFTQETNHFPPVGNVGIGTADIVDNLTIGEYGGSITLRDRTTLLAGTSALGRLKFYDYFGESASIALEHNYYFGGAPRAMLFSVNGAERLRIISNGNVGIGTNVPNSLLHLNGTGTTDPLGTVILNIQSAHSAATIGSGGIIKFTNNVESADVAAIRTYTEGSHDVSLRFQTGYGTGKMADRIVIGNQGNVGIGTVSPREKLSVNGKIRAHEIKVETANWPDYVFAKDYKLPSLAETEKHIKEKGHLPGIPTAAEVKADGIDLGEMNAKLLQKIEELTLYLIEKDKEIKSIKSDYQELRKMVMDKKD